MATKRWKSVSWARDKRDELYLLLGGICNGRGCDCTEELQFDHIEAIDWEPSRKSWSSRIAEYRRAYAQGNLQLLCDSCHAVKTRNQPELEENPF